MIVLYDDATARTFEPFATSRPLGEVRAGALLIRERWALCLDAPIAAAVAATHLHHFAEFDAPRMASLPIPAGSWLVNTRALPMVGVDFSSARSGDVIRIAGRVAAVRLRTALNDGDMLNGTTVLDALVERDAISCDVDGVWLEETWDIIRHLSTQLSQDIPALAATLNTTVLTAAMSTPMSGVVLGDAPVFVESGARIEPFTVFDTSAGPVLLRAGAVVQSFTRVVGPCYVGRETMLLGERVAASSIGDHCRIHGELSMSVFIGHANKGHDGFVGHSIVGRWVNMGAGTITSNLKNTYGTVAMWTTRGVRDTGLQFAGTFFGDHAKTGIGLRLNTGSVLGTGANVMDAMPPKAVAPFAWGVRAPYDVYDAAKFAETAERMMARRHIAMNDRYRDYLSSIMSHAQTSEYWPR